MIDFGLSIVTGFSPYKNIDADTLHNIKHVLIFASIRRRFFFTTIAMQVKNINLVKGAHQLLTDLTMYYSIDKTIVANIGQNAWVVLLNIVLP